MRKFAAICFRICIASIVVAFVLFLIMIWAEVDDVFMWKAVSTAFACFVASGLVFAITDKFLRQPERETEATGKTSPDS